jgi:hypothetical protein
MVNRPNRQDPSIATPTVTVDSSPSRIGWYRGKDQGATRDSGERRAAPVTRQRRTRYLELFSVAVVIALIVGIDVYIFGINKRLSTIENELSEVKTWAFPAGLLEGKYASLNARMHALTKAFSGIDAKFSALSSQQGEPGSEANPLANEAPEISDAQFAFEAPAAGVAQAATDQAFHPAESVGVPDQPKQKATTASAPVNTPPVSGDGPSTENATPRPTAARRPPVAPGSVPSLLGAPPTAPDKARGQERNRERHAGGSWVINLLSDPNAARAKRFAAKARSHGITVEENRAEVKGRLFWRVQLTGFATAQEARARANDVKRKLHLKDVWIFKQQG